MEFELNSIFRISKSYAERYNEYCSILSGSSSEVFSIPERWSLYLEVNMDRPSHGWYAYWNILRTYCDGLNITFPKVVKVRVVDVNYEKLSADISIINIQEDDELYSITDVIESVPLKDLYVIASQEIQDLDAIADSLDQLRFFYHHLWWPWVDDDENIKTKSIDWVSDHLEHRLKLYYDKLEVNMPYTSAKKIKRLMEKCKESYEMLQNIEELNPVVVDSVRDELISMKVELGQWSIPEIRKLKNEEIKKANAASGALITLQENEIHIVDTLLRRVHDTLALEELNNIPIKVVSPSFENCHLNYDANDIILLTPGNYELDYMEYFDFPVLIKGLKSSSSSKETVICDKRSFWSIFQFLATTVRVENIDFDLKFCTAVFIVKRGTLVLNDVRLNNFRSKDTVAVKLHKNTKLVARRCRFSNFTTAIICQQDAFIELDDCTFENNATCMQFVKGTKITINNCDMRNTENVPFLYDHFSSDDEMQEKSCEPLDHLLKIPGITINNIQLDDEMMAVENT